MKGWFVIDAIAAIPFDLLFFGSGTSDVSITWHFVKINLRFYTILLMRKSLSKSQGFWYFLNSLVSIIVFTIIWRCYLLYASSEPWHYAHHIRVFDGIVDINNHRNTEVSSVVEIITCSKTSGSVLTIRRCYSPTHAYILRTHSSLAGMCILCGGVHREKVSTWTHQLAGCSC